MFINMINSKPKILFILHLPPPVHGAAMVGSFINQSDKINNTFECSYINLQTSRSLEDTGKGFFSKLFRFVKLYFKVISTLFKTRYDLCYMTLNTTGAAFYKELVVVILLKLFRQNIIYHFHNKGVAAASKKIINQRLYSYVFKKTKSILLSPHLYRDVKYYVDEKDVYYCPNGIPKSSNTGVRFDKNNNHRCEFLFLSNMIADKGVYDLLEAVCLLKKDHNNFRCHFVGGWSDVTPQIFEDYVKSNHLSEIAYAHGPKYGYQKNGFFEMADVFVFPTFYHNEAFPLVNLEAMQYGLPIIATPEGGIPDVIIDGVTGFLIPQKSPKLLAAKMKRFIEYPQLRITMGAAGKERFEKLFTLKKFEIRLTDILTEAIEKFQNN